MTKRPPRAVDVRPLSDHRLEVRFDDGVRGVVDCRALVHSPHAGVFAALADDARFAAVTIVHGAVSWPGEIDLAPDAMHDALARDGQWILN